MTKLSTQVDSKSDHNNNSSDLTAIRGIGASRMRWLNSLGIYTIAELGQASADALAAQPKADGRVPSRSELEEWIAQAQNVMATHQPTEPAYPQSVRTPQTPEIELAVPACAVPPPDWNSVATFKVDYQTRQTADKLEQRTVIHHLETGATECWEDLEVQSIQPWMLGHIKTTESPAETACTATPKITQLRLIQPGHSRQAMIASKTQPLFSGDIKADQPFALEAAIEFTELAESNLPDQIACQVQCVVYDISTGATATLGDVTVNIPLANNPSYYALLPELMLPHAGIYRLKVFANLQSQRAADAEATSGCFKVPILQGV